MLQAKFQNRRTTPSERKVRGEKEKKKLILYDNGLSYNLITSPIQCQLSRNENKLYELSCRLVLSKCMDFFSNEEGTSDSAWNLQLSVDFNTGSHDISCPLPGSSGHDISRRMWLKTT